MACQKHLNIPLQINNNPTYPQLPQLNDQQLWERLSQASLVTLLKNTDHGTPEQLNPHHEEGSIWNHTQMVYQEMRQYCDEHQIQGAERTACLIVAFCHDFGKVDTRGIKVHDNGETRVHFYDHPSFSSLRFIEFCQELGLTGELMTNGWYYDLLQAVYLHDQALNVYAHAGDKFPNNVFNRWQRLLTYNRRLALLLPAICHSDNLGRLTQAPRKNPDTHNLFEEKAEELILNDLVFPEQRELLMSQPVGNLRQLAQGLQKKMPVLLVATGLPGSGKSTVFNELQKQLGDAVEIIGLDQFTKQVAEEQGLTYRQLFDVSKSGKINYIKEAEHRHDEYLEKRLRSSTPPQILILDRTHVTVKSRNRSMDKVDQILQRLKKEKKAAPAYQKNSLVFLTSAQECLKRDQQRPDHQVGDEVINFMGRNFAPPLYGELPIWGDLPPYSYEHLLYATNISDGQILFAEQPLENILEQPTNDLSKSSPR